VFSVAALHLHPGAEAVEATWRARLDAAGGGGAVELGVGHATAEQLVEAAFAAARPGAARLRPLDEVVLLDKVAEQLRGPLARIAASRGLRRSLGRTFAALRRMGLGPAALVDAGRRAGLDEPARVVARALEAYQARLDAEQLEDDAGAWYAGCRALAAGTPVRPLADVAQVETHGLFEWDAARLALLDALLERGLAVRVALPPGDDPSLARAIVPSLAALEARHARARLECVRRPLCDKMPHLAMVEAAHPAGEARAVARRVRDLVDAGVPPEEIAVCAATAARRERLEEALARYDVPVAARRRAAATEAPPVRLALGLYELVEERIAREPLIALVRSRYVAGGVDGPRGWVPPHRVARALREAGVGDAGEGFAARLEAWARAQPAARSDEARAVVGHLVAWVEALRALPADATVAAHAQAARRLFERLELPARARGFRGEATGGGAELRAVARDQAAARALEVALDDLPRAAARVGLAGAIPRARFARLLDEALAAARPGGGGVRGAAVELTDPPAVVGRRFRHLFLCGLVDGELPARAAEDPLFSDEARRALNRALGAPVLPLAARADELQPLAFAAALAAADDVQLSWPRSDEEGAPLLRSPLLDALPPTAVERTRRDPIPRAVEARALDELLARGALEAHGDRASRLSSPDRQAAALLPLIANGAALARVAPRIAVERARERFFAGELQAHAYTGALAGEALLVDLAARLPGREAAPLSASAVESYAACPFQFFLRYLLGAAKPEEADDDLDPLARGRLYHAALERGFRRLADEGRLPLRGDAAERAALQAACGEIAAEWRAREPIGHEGLFAVQERRLRRQVDAIWRAEVEAPPVAGCTPREFEKRFEGLAVDSFDGERRIFLRGSIDRVDRGAGRAVVLDYKSGNRQGANQRLKPDALCVTSFQLPLYAAALHAAEPATAIEARYYILRDAYVTDPVDDPDRFGLDHASRERARARGVRNVADAVWDVYEAARAGGFAVRPREGSCERCGMQSACRVGRPPPATAPGSDEP
jgi:RecB family exonuclease